MEGMDVHDWSEEEARLIAQSVKLPWRRRRLPAAPSEKPTLHKIPSATWPLGVKGTLRWEEIYDDLIPLCHCTARKWAKVVEREGFRRRKTGALSTSINTVMDVGRFLSIRT